MKNSCGFVLMAGLLMCSCASTIDTRKPSGDSVRITLRDFTVHRAEALAVSDSLLYVNNAEKQVCISRLSDTRSVCAYGYKVGNVSKWFWGTAFLVGGISLGLALGTSRDSDLEELGVRHVIAGLDVIAAVAAALCYLAPEQDVIYSDLPDPAQLGRLRLHCRYPQGLSAGQWDEVLSSHGQTEFCRLQGR